MARGPDKHAPVDIWGHSLTGTYKYIYKGKLTMRTKHFGEFIDNCDKHKDLEIYELEGTVKVHELNGIRAAFLFVPLTSNPPGYVKPGKPYVKYDLPAFAQPYDNHIVACLARVVTKEINNRIYNKLIVIRLKALRRTTEALNA